MKFNSIYLKEDNRERLINFSVGNNLVYSEENSKGKTTLLRMLLYSLGYPIPNTKNIQFEKCQIETNVTTDSGEVLIFTRKAKECLVLQKGGIKTTYALPAQENELHQMLFGTENANLLKNILGLFYFDQEKGWTLLNRGVVIGSIHFNIEELIRGLENIDCSQYIQLLDNTKRDLEKFKQMFSISQYQKKISTDFNNLAIESYNTTIEKNLNQLKIRLNIHKKELARIDKVLNDNKRFQQFINEMGLMVSIAPDTPPIPITVDNIVGWKDSKDYLLTKQKIVTFELNAIQSEIDKLERERKVEDQQMTFFNDVETIAEIFDKRIASLPLNEFAIKTKIEHLEKEKERVTQIIKDLTYRSSNLTINSIYLDFKKYLDELDIDTSSLHGKHIFTSNLKELSGAILHKTVFAFRLACLRAVEQKLGIKLPIILDSPRGKEVDELNIVKMISILNNDFSENQIIIASIFEYEDLKDVTKIEIHNYLIE